MARFDSGVFGFLKGKIGSIVARMRYGEVYIAEKPLKYKIKSEKLKLTQKVFGRRQRLNTQLRKNKKIQALWKAIDAEGLNNNTKLMIRNKPFVSYERLLPGCGFTPVSDDKIIVNNIHFEGFDIVFDFKIGRANPKKLLAPYEVFCILLFDRLLHNSGMGLIRDKVIFGATGFNTFDNETTDSAQTFRFMYIDEIHSRRYIAEKAYVMIAAIKFNEMKNKYEWTDTYFEELQNYVPENKKTKWNEHIYRLDD